VNLVEWIATRDAPLLSLYDSISGTIWRKYVASASQAAPVEPIAVPTAGWILGPRNDFLLFLGTPFLIVPLIILAQRSWTVPVLYFAVASFGSFGHHLPGMMRAYGDRALFERFKVRFIVSPIFLAITCIGFNLWQPAPLSLVVFCWGVWHLFMQAHGLARIYDAKVGSTDSTTVRLDSLLVGTWFIAAVVLADLRLPQLIGILYDCGFPAISPSSIDALRLLSLFAVAGVTFAYVVNAVRRTRERTPPNPIKLALQASTIGFFVFCNLMVEHLLLAVLMFELFHDVQYLTIVWVFNRRRADSDLQAGAFTRFLFRQRWYLALLYVGLVAGYGSLSIAGRSLESANIGGVIGGLIYTSTLLHFYFDGFIWKLRDADVSKTLGVKADAVVGAAGIRWLAGGAGHALKWGLFILPLSALGLSAAVTPPLRDVEQLSSIAELAPTNGKTHARLAEARARNSDYLGAIESGRRALELLSPDGPHASAWFTTRQNLVTALMRRSLALVDQGDLEGAAPLVREAVDLDSSVSSRVRETAKSAQASLQLKSASAHYELATLIDPSDLESWVGLAQVRAAQGRFTEARSSAARATSLAPDAPSVVELQGTLQPTH
jgi:tetratricopeptide (TPR) repeat protein